MISPHDEWRRRGEGWSDVAYHEAGHSVVAAVLGAEIKAIGIARHGLRGGLTLPTWPVGAAPSSRLRVNAAASAAAGALAEAMSMDPARQRDLAAQDLVLRRELGCDADLAEARRLVGGDPVLLREAIGIAADILQQPAVWQRVQDLATWLMLHGVAGPSDVRGVMAGA